MLDANVMEGYTKTAIFIGYAIENNLINRPPPDPVGADGKLYPYAFQMTTFMLKPYPKLAGDVENRIFNYRLSRARRVIENSFGIAAARFRIFRRPIIASINTVFMVIKAVVALHNYLMKTQRLNGEHDYCPPGFADQDGYQVRRRSDWRVDVQGYTGLAPIAHWGPTITQEQQKMYAKSSSNILTLQKALSAGNRITYQEQ